jgi:hypothetical protein
MRVPPDHLGIYRFGHVSELECASFLRDARVIDHLQKEIAEFILQIRKITAKNGIRHLVGFLDGVRRDRLECLFKIPRAAGARRAQRCHDLKKPLQRFRSGRRVQFCHGPCSSR